MPGDDTVAVLLDIAIDAERKAQAFYGGLARRFSHLPELSDFWRGILEEEERIEHP